VSAERAKEGGSEADKNDLDKKREKLRECIDKWRAVQKSLVPQVADHVEQQCLDRYELVDFPEHEQLFLPSDFSQSEHIHLGLVQLAENQQQLLEGTAYDVLHCIHTLIKALNITKHDKAKNSRRQVANTRARAKIRDIEFQCDVSIMEYNAIRGVLLSLGLSSNDAQFHPLTLKDTQMKRTNICRQVGDSCRVDGFLWTNTGIGMGSRPSSNVENATKIINANTSRASIGTQGKGPRSVCISGRYHFPCLANGVI